MDLRRFGLSTFLWPGMDLLRWVDLATELGLGGVELRADPRAACPRDLGAADRRALREELESRDLWSSVHAPIYGVNLASPLPSLAAAALGEVVEAVDLAVDLCSRLVVVHPGHVDVDYLSVDGEREHAWRRVEFALEVVLARARPAGVRVAVENKQRGRGWDMIYTPDDHNLFLTRFPDLGACLDLGHLHTTGGDPAAYVAGLGDRLVHVHLHDNGGEQDDHLGLGRGGVAWREALGVLKTSGYGGSIVLEIPDPEELRQAVSLVGGA